MTRKKQDELRIVRLTAENVKRLKAVEITPNGDIVTITGRNAQGKTSVLDAIWLALGGGAASKATPRPVRDGETEASVTLDLGPLTVTRTWKDGRSHLAVTNSDGAAYGSPQSVLDALIGRLAFDPLEFTRLSAKDQRQALLDLIDLDVDLAALTAQRKALYDQRTDVGRKAKELGGVPPVDDTLAADEASAGDLLAQLRDADQQRRDRADLEHRRDLAFKRGIEINKAIEELQAELKEVGRQWQDAADELSAKPEAPDTAAIEEALSSLEATNQKVRANNQARATRALHESLRTSYDNYTAQIAELDKAKTDALAAASFPVDGLSFDEAGVTYQGVPFAQASAAEQIRVSLAMAMALNPTLRVIRILDGSLLDDDNLAMIADAAKAGGYQVWIERVNDPSESAIVIEDGEVAK